MSIETRLAAIERAVERSESVSFADLLKRERESYSRRLAAGEDVGAKARTLKEAYARRMAAAGPWSARDLSRGGE